MARVTYGVTPWGTWVLEMLESYNETGRIERGHSYANTGKVDALNISGSTIAARVAGHYDPWYYVTITLPPLSDANRKKTESILKAHPLDFAALENGTMTAPLIEAFKQKKLRLFPTRWRQIESDCSCPDSANPCKHIAAVLYIVSKEIDHDPRLLFQLAGIDLQAFRQKLLDEKGGVQAAADVLKYRFSSEKIAQAEKTAAAPEEPAQDLSQYGKAAVQLEEYAHPIPVTLRCPLTASEHQILRHSLPETARLPKRIPAQLPAEEQTLLPAGSPQYARLPHFSLQESYLPLITALLPSTVPFYGGGFAAVLTGLYHQLITVQNRRFDMSLEDKIKAVMKTARGASAAVLCGSRRLAYMNVTVAGSLSIKDHGFPLLSAQPLSLRIKGYVSKAGDASDSRSPAESVLTFVEALPLFQGMIPPEDSPAGIKAVCVLFALTEQLISESALVPAVCADKKKKTLHIFWKPFSAAREVQEALFRLEPFITEDFFPPVRAWGQRYCAELLLTSFLTEYIQSAKYMSKGIRAQDREIASLFFYGSALDLRTPGNSRLPVVIANCLTALQYDSGSLNFRLILAESKVDDFALSAEVRHAEETGGSFRPLHKIGALALTKSKTVAFTVALSSYLPKLTALAAEKSVPLSHEETAAFLKDAAPLLNRFGVEVVLPKALQKTLKPRPVIRLEKPKGAGAVQSYLSFDSLMDYDRSIMLGDTVMSIAEFKKLMKQSTGLVKFNDRYVLVDPEYTARLLETVQNDSPDAHEVLQGVFTGETVMENGEPFSYSLFTDTEAAVPETLQATLRPYQLKGFQWLYSTIKSGFGCLLGDDMGLGKTLQVITLILKLKEQGFTHDGVLIAAPASLLSNWEHEIGKFAPDLSCKILHGQGRRFSAGTDIHLTTYQTLQRDAKKLADRTFDCLIIDEAQAVKNTQTKNAQALRTLRANARIAMTGTPVENSLEDMRALFDFIIPGYLGSADSFCKKWRLPIELHGDAETAESFQKITAPFLLRRLKTDPAVISDLPEKIVTPQYCRLTPLQTALYESLIQEQLKQVLKTEDGMQRNALVLKLLTALKQVCNHPHVYDSENPPDLQLSEKAMTLMQLLEEILSAGEKVLIFSQYTQTLFLLQKLIKEHLGDESLLLHGQMPLSARKKAVEAFQTDSTCRIFLISLKAGGTGLNLTAASRVIHFDLWYNPAIEDQATDRAFRIGQHKTVFVSRFICAGTFEEKIDAMIQKKRAISGMSLRSGETWIGKMSNEELAELFG